MHGVGPGVAPRNARYPTLKANNQQSGLGGSGHFYPELQVNLNTRDPRTAANLGAGPIMRPLRMMRLRGTKRCNDRAACMLAAPSVSVKQRHDMCEKKK